MSECDQILIIQGLQYRSIFLNFTNKTAGSVIVQICANLIPNLSNLRGLSSNFILSFAFYYFSAIAFTITKERNEVISFTFPTHQLHHLLFIRNPLDSFNWASYTEPLYYTAWIMIGVFCLVTPFFLYVTAT